MPADKTLKKGLLLLLILLFFSACQPPAMTSTILPPSETPLPTFTSTAKQTSRPTSEPTKAPPTPTSTTTPFQVCSPLEGETFETLPSIIVNPLVIPPFGHDDGHHGVDFAYYQRGDRKSIQGIEVYAILSGKTLLTLDDKTPYGYALLIETPLSDLPEKLRESLEKSYQTVPEDVLYQGECPELQPPETTSDLSIYHLYAHLEEMPSFNQGDPIPCGTVLGTVGNSGRSSNPHLHLETRLGPSGANLGDMAFYETKYTEQQRANYCLWRMSGYFQLFDPFLLFEVGD
jgi:murein DD-endopeptidase MepM/ murein hydrolase activator NlpD